MTLTYVAGDTFAMALEYEADSGLDFTASGFSADLKLKSPAGTVEAFSATATDALTLYVEVDEAVTVNWRTGPWRYEWQMEFPDGIVSTVPREVSGEFTLREAL